MLVRNLRYSSYRTLLENLTIRKGTKTNSVHGFVVIATIVICIVIHLMFSVSVSLIVIDAV